MFASSARKTRNSRRLDDPTEHLAIRRTPSAGIMPGLAGTIEVGKPLILAGSALMPERTAVAVNRRTTNGLERFQAEPFDRRKPWV